MSRQQQSSEMVVQSSQLVIPDVSVLQFIDAMPQYNTSEGRIQQLDILRTVQELSTQFFWQGVAVPRREQISFAARETKETTISIQPNSILLSISGYCEQPDGFNISIMDKGSKTNLVSKDFAFRSHFAAVSGMNPSTDPTGPYWLLSPYTLTNPGQLQVKITNLSGSTAIIQVVIGVATPYIKEKQVPLTGEAKSSIGRTIAGGYGNGGNVKRQLNIANMPIVNVR